MPYDKDDPYTVRKFTHIYRWQDFRDDREYNINKEKYEGNDSKQKEIEAKYEAILWNR